MSLNIYFLFTFYNLILSVSHSFIQSSLHHQIYNNEVSTYIFCIWVLICIRRPSMKFYHLSLFFLTLLLWHETREGDGRRESSCIVRGLGTASCSQITRYMTLQTPEWQLGRERNRQRKIHKETDTSIPGTWYRDRITQVKNIEREKNGVRIV